MDEWQTALQELREALIERLASKSVTQAKLARSSKISPAKLTYFKTGEQGLTYPPYKRLCKVLGVRAVKLESDEALEGERIHLVGQVHAGSSADAGDSVIVSKSIKDLGLLVDREFREKKLRCGRGLLVAYEVSGDSMSPMYQQGDIVLVEETSDVRKLRAEEHVIVYLGRADGLVLKAYDPKSRIIYSLNGKRGFYRSEDYPEMTLRGRVCALIRTQF